MQLSVCLVDVHIESITVDASARSSARYRASRHTVHVVALWLTDRWAIIATLGFAFIAIQSAVGIFNT
jgi:hypothetical protein